MAQNEQNSKQMSWEDQRQAYLKTKAEYERMLQTDPEYRKQREKEIEEFLKIALLNDSL